MVPGYHRPAVVKVNLGAIRRNLENEMKHLDPGQRCLQLLRLMLMAMVQLKWQK